MDRAVHSKQVHLACMGQLAERVADILHADHVGIICGRLLDDIAVAVQYGLFLRRQFLRLLCKRKNDLRLVWILSQGRRLLRESVQLVAGIETQGGVKEIVVAG